MKKIYSTPSIELQVMNTANAFMATSIGTGENNYGISSGSNASNYEGGAPEADARSNGNNKLDLI